MYFKTTADIALERIVQISDPEWDCEQWKVAFYTVFWGDFQCVLEVTVFGGVVLGYETSNLTCQYKELSKKKETITLDWSTPLKYPKAQAGAKLKQIPGALLLVSRELE